MAENIIIALEFLNLTNIRYVIWHFSNKNSNIAEMAKFLKSFVYGTWLFKQFTL